MGLMDRINARREPAQQAGAGTRSKPTVARLREAVKKHLSMEELARIMGENPERAKNELRLACRQAMMDASWDAVDAARRQKLINELMDMVFGLGPIDALLNDETITEIMVNGTHSVYYERDGRLFRSPLRFETDEQVRVLIDRIIGPLGRRIDESSPMVNARLPQGHRVNAIIEPLSLIGPVVTIRAFARRTFSLEQMVAMGSFSKAEAQFFRWAIVARKNIAVSGGTGSGKTTLLNALSLHIPEGERVITIEDSAELRFLEHPHVVRLEARPRNAEGIGEVTIRELVINALRMRPDRIIVGECRGGETIDMLQAMSTGHDGSLTTLHANAPLEVVDRLVTMVRYALDLPIDAIEAQIGNAFDLIIQTSRASDGTRYVSEIASLTFDRDVRRCRILPLYRRGSNDDRGKWLAVPSWIDELEQRGLARPKEVEAWKRCVA